MWHKQYELSPNTYQTVENTLVFSAKWKVLGISQYDGSQSSFGYPW